MSRMPQRHNHLLGRTKLAVEIAVSDLHFAHYQAELAGEFLANFIRRKVTEGAFGSLDEAAEKSEDLCHLLFLLSEIETIGSALAPAFSGSFVVTE